MKFRRTLYWACDYSSMLRYMLIHVCKRGPWRTKSIPWLLVAFPPKFLAIRCYAFDHVREILQPPARYNPSILSAYVSSKQFRTKRVYAGNHIRKIVYKLSQCIHFISCVGLHVDAIWLSYASTVHIHYFVATFYVLVISSCDIWSSNWFIFPILLCCFATTGSVMRYTNQSCAWDPDTTKHNIKWITSCCFELSSPQIAYAIQNLTWFSSEKEID